MGAFCFNAPTDNFEILGGESCYDLTVRQGNREHRHDLRKDFIGSKIKNIGRETMKPKEMQKSPLVVEGFTIGTFSFFA